MFVAALVSFFALSAIAPSASAMPSHGLVRNVHRAVPAQFKERGYNQDEDLLESYATYAERYQLFDCEDQHNTTFWDQCCHPLLKDESEDALPDSCWANVTDCGDGPSTSSAPHTSTPLPTTTSVAVKTTTTSDKPKTTSTADKPSTTAVETTSKPPTTTHSTSAAQPTTSSTSSGGSWISGGYGTYFYQEGNYGACGKKHSDSDLIVAVDIQRYGSPDSESSLCGKTVRIVNTDNGNTVEAVVADVCPTCDNENCLDMSLGTFEALQPKLSVGQINIKYQYV